MANLENKTPLLNEFFESFQQMPKQILEALLNVTVDEDQRNVINSFVPAFNDQFRQLSSFALERATIAPRQGLAEAEQFLRVSSATQLTGNLPLALPSIGSLAGKIGIVGIVHEIKKIVSMIFELIGQKVPRWLEIVFLIIDQILNLLLGGDSVRTRSALSELESNFLVERMHTENLRRASSFPAGDDNDED